MGPEQAYLDTDTQNEKQTNLVKHLLLTFSVSRQTVYFVQISIELTDTPQKKVSLCF